MPSIESIKIERDALLINNSIINIGSISIENIPDKIINDVIQITNTLIQADGLDASSIMIITANIMNTLSKYKKINGDDKKKLVILVINTAIKYTSLSDETQILLQEMVKTTIPTTIDLFVAVSKGRYKFKYIKKFFICYS
jgi:membrane protease subunit (stomatin/prohibitin family)